MAQTIEKKLNSLVNGEDQELFKNYSRYATLSQKVKYKIFKRISSTSSKPGILPIFQGLPKTWVLSNFRGIWTFHVRRMMLKILNFVIVVFKKSAKLLFLQWLKIKTIPQGQWFCLKHQASKEKTKITKAKAYKLVMKWVS